jgi:glycosyltransferase involved in cell wall biosynthesis
VARETASQFADVTSVKLEAPQPKSSTPFGRRLRHLIDTVPWELERAYSPAFAAAITRLVSTRRFEFILPRYIYQARYVLPLARQTSAQIVVDIDDIETVKVERMENLKSSRGLYEASRIRLNTWLLAQFHRRHLPAASACIVCSEDDRRYVLQRRWTSQVAIVPNAIDVARFTTGPLRLQSKTLLFSGTLSYEPNVEGLRWFVRDVLPQLRALVPDVKLRIVGRTPVDAIKALDGEPGISVHADVPDMLPYYDEASVVLAPIRVGSGTRIKILEAAASRRPVVSTTIGAEGLGFEPGRHCLIEDQADRFAQACADVLRDESLANRLTEAGYGRVRQCFDVAGTQAVVHGLFDELERRSMQAPAWPHVA